MPVKPASNATRYLLALCAAAAVALLFSKAATSQDSQRPDFNGVWQVVQPQQALKSASGAEPPLTPAASAQYAKNKAALKARQNSIDTLSRCLPPGVPRIMNLPRPFKLVQNDRMLAFLFEWNHVSRWVYIGRDHFEPLGPAYLGQSVAKWDGATLVIDTNNFNDATFLDDSGLPHSGQLHLVERLTLKSRDELQNRIVLTDPATFTQSWETVLTFKRVPAAVADDDWCLGKSGLVKMGATR